MMKGFDGCQQILSSDAEYKQKLTYVYWFLKPSINRMISLLYCRTWPKTPEGSPELIA